MLDIQKSIHKVIDIVASLNYTRLFIYTLVMILLVEIINWLYRRNCISEVGTTDACWRLPRVPVYLLILYVNVILRLTLFGRELGSKDHSISRFYFSLSEIFSGHGFLNTMMFVPFGFLIYLVFKSNKSLENILLTFLFSALFSNAIELIQYLTKTGRFEISDLVCNTAGGLVGGIAGWLAVKIMTANED